MCPEIGHANTFESYRALKPVSGFTGIRRPGKEEKMREGIFVTGSTSKEIHVEVCSKCHSFYTGTQKTAAAKGRIDKFNRKYGLGNN